MLQIVICMRRYPNGVKVCFCVLFQLLLLFFSVLDQIIDDFGDLIRNHYDLKAEFGDPSASTDVCILCPFFRHIRDEDTGRSCRCRPHYTWSRNCDQVQTDWRSNLYRIFSDAIWRGTRPIEIRPNNEDQRGGEEFWRVRIVSRKSSRLQRQKRRRRLLSCDGVSVGKLLDLNTACHSKS